MLLLLWSFESRETGPRRLQNVWRLEHALRTKRKVLVTLLHRPVDFLKYAWQQCCSWETVKVASPLWDVSSCKTVQQNIVIDTYIRT